MSVIINNMAMPQNCYECRFCETYLGHHLCAAFLNYIEDPRSGRLDTCPLIELPDHGELIDVAELWEKASRSRADAKGMVHLKTLTSKIDPSDYIAWNIRLEEREMFERMVESAPVIIPAESTMGQVKAEMAVIPAERSEE